LKSDGYRFYGSDAHSLLAAVACSGGDSSTGNSDSSTDSGDSILLS